MSRASTASLRLVQSRAFGRQSAELAAVLSFAMTGLLVHSLSVIASVEVLPP